MTWGRACSTLAAFLLLVSSASPGTAQQASGGIGEDDSGLLPTPTAIASVAPTPTATAQPAQLIAAPEASSSPLVPPLPPFSGGLSVSDPLNGGYLIANMHGFLFHERMRDWQEDVNYTRWLGARVIRAFGTDNIGLRQWDGKRVGSQIAAVAPVLRANQVKLILAFVNNHRAVPGEAPNSSGWLDNYWQLLLPFYASNWRGAYLQFVRDLVTTVQASGAQDVVLACELGNELHTPQSPAAIEPFITSAVQEVRKVDATTPILPGTMGANHVQPWNRTSPIARWLYCEAPVDAYTLHAYDWVSTDRGGDMPIDWDLNGIIQAPCPSGRRLPVIAEELGSSRALAGMYTADQESSRLDEELRQIRLVHHYPQVVGFGVWDAESPRALDRSFFDSRRGLTSYSVNALGGGSCYDPFPDAGAGVRCQLEEVLRHLPLVRASPTPQWTPGPNATGGAPLIGGFDPPSDDLTPTASATLRLSGWLADKTAVGGAGIDALNVYLGASSDAGALLGRADLNVPRPEPVAIAGNPDLGAAGFALRIPVDGLPGGSVPMTVAARTSQHGTWFTTIWVTLPVLGSSAAPEPLPEIVATPAPRVLASAPPPKLQVASPRPGASVSSNYIVQGSAYDPSAGAGQGSGIDHVDVFLEPDRDGGGRFLGSAKLGQVEASVAASQPAGPEFILPLRITPGTHTLFVHAHSAVTGLETVVAIPITAS
jgi:hypothetical protein